jgi:hypothetical protein
VSAKFLNVSHLPPLMQPMVAEFERVARVHTHVRRCVDLNVTGRSVSTMSRWTRRTGATTCWHPYGSDRRWSIYER